jgi:threonine dehydratase
VTVPGIVLPVVLKLEQLQLGGSFKSRGAFSKLLGSDIPPAGVSAASGGNHGIAVALASASLGIPCRVFVPEATPAAKIDAIERHGAVIERVGRSYAESREAALAHAEEHGTLDVPAFDDPLVVAGQGTLAREFERQADVDTVLIAVGGGGLIAGFAAWTAGALRLIGVEPERSSAMAAALEAGHVVDVETGGVAADSLGSRRVSELTLALSRNAGVVPRLVPDEAIVEAQHWLWREARIATEPGGATALAALLSGAYTPAPDERVAVIVCGANVDPASLGAGSVESRESQATRR